MSDYFFTLRGAEDVFPRFLSQLPLRRIAELQLVSPQWRRLISSLEYGRLLLREEGESRRAEQESSRPEQESSRSEPKSSRPKSALFVICNRDSFMGVIHIDTLLRGMQELTRREFAGISFPVRRIIGSVDGLICLLTLMENMELVFVINPRTLRIRDMIGDTDASLLCAFGWKLIDGVRCHIILKIIDSAFNSVKVFNIHTNQWGTIDFAWQDFQWRCRVEAKGCAFVNGAFLFLGSVLRDNARAEECVLVFDGGDTTLSFITLPPEMRGLALEIGNIGDHKAALWSTNMEEAGFWLLNHTIQAFRWVAITAYPTGVHFQPLCLLNGAQMLMLRQHARFDGYNLESNEAVDVAVQYPHPELYTYFHNETFQVICFLQTFMSPGEYQD